MTLKSEPINVNALSLPFEGRLNTKLSTCKSSLKSFTLNMSLFVVDRQGLGNSIRSSQPTQMSFEGGKVSLIPLKIESMTGNCLAMT